MGIWDTLFGWLMTKKKQANILCVGLDNSGKSTIVNQLKPEKARSMHIVPTVGFKMDKFSSGSLTLTVFDMSGQGKYRNLWERQCASCDAIIFVIDSTDSIRMPVVKEELKMLLTNRYIKHEPSLPFLFFANKSDLRHSFSAVKCAQLLGLDGGEWTKGGSSDLMNGNAKLGRPWHICESNALTGDGVEEGIQWLSDQLLEIRSNK